MIPQQKDKKNKFIYIYIFFFILIVSINNKNFSDKELFSNKLIYNIKGLSETDNHNLIKDLIDINKNNIFKLDKNKISNKIDENNLVLNFLAKKVKTKLFSLILFDISFLSNLKMLSLFKLIKSLFNFWLSTFDKPLTSKIKLLENNSLLWKFLLFIEVIRIKKSM